MCYLQIYKEKKKDKNRGRSLFQLVNKPSNHTSFLNWLPVTFCNLFASYNIKILVTDLVSRVPPVVLTPTFNFWDHSEFLSCLHAS